MRSRARRHAGILGTAALQGLVNAAWTAAAELPPTARRLTRLALPLSALAVGAATARTKPEPGPEEELGPEQKPTQWRAGAAGPWRTGAAAVLIPAVVVGPVVLRRRLERRWLSQLTRGGHPHPHRVVAVRIGLLSMAVMLFGDLVKELRPKPAPRPLTATDTESVPIQPATETENGPADTV